MKIVNVWFVEEQNNSILTLLSKLGMNSCLIDDARAYKWTLQLEAWNLQQSLEKGKNDKVIKNLLFKMNVYSHTSC